MSESFSKRMGGDKASSRVSKIAGSSGHASDCSSMRKGYAIGGSVMDGPMMEDEMGMEGDGVIGRLDRPSRMGKKSPTTVVNVTVAGKSADAPPPGLPPPGRSPMPPPPPMGPPPGAMGPGGPPMPPGQMPPLPLGPMKNGGRVGYKAGGKVSNAKPLSDRYDGSTMPVPPLSDLETKPKYAKGGDVTLDEVQSDWQKPKKHAAGGKVEMDAGAGSGEGRLEQAHRQKNKG